RLSRRPRGMVVARAQPAALSPRHGNRRGGAGLGWALARPVPRAAAGAGLDQRPRPAGARRQDFHGPLGRAAEAGTLMPDSRERILGNLRRSLRRGGDGGDAASAAVRARLAEHRANTIPARATELDRDGRIRLFQAMAEEVAATVAHVTSLDDVPDAVADYLARHNLPSDMVVTEDPELAPIPWERRPTLALRPGVATGADL